MRRVAIGLVSLGLGLGLAGCDALTPGPPPKSAALQLTEAAQQLKAKSYVYTVDAGGKRRSSGSHEPTGKNATAAFVLTDPTYGFTVNADAVKLGTSIWVKPDLGELAGAVPVLGELNGKWLHVKTSKLPKTFAARFGTGNPAAVDALVGSVVAASVTDDGRLVGTVDLAKAGATLGVAKSTLTALGASAGAVPFVATVDPAGPLASFTVTVPAFAKNPASEVALTFSKFGTAPAIVRPPKAKTVEAPTAAYSLLAGS